MMRESRIERARYRCALAEDKKRRAYGCDAEAYIEAATWAQLWGVLLKRLEEEKKNVWYHDA